jgi:hypothetical protein
MKKPRGDEPRGLPRPASARETWTGPKYQDVVISATNPFQSAPDVSAGRNVVVDDGVQVPKLVSIRSRRFRREK